MTQLPACDAQASSLDAFDPPLEETFRAAVQPTRARTATAVEPLVSKLLDRRDEPAISPYPFFAVTRRSGFSPIPMHP